MEFWKTLLENPSGDKSMDDFAMVMDKTPKLVFSHTLQKIDWESAKLATRDIKEEVLELKQQAGKDIYIGSRSLILQLMKLNLLDEFQLCIHPVVAGGGLPLFENINTNRMFKLLKTKTFNSGAIVLYYEPSVG